MWTTMPKVKPCGVRKASSATKKGGLVVWQIALVTRGASRDSRFMQRTGRTFPPFDLNLRRPDQS